MNELTKITALAIGGPLHGKRLRSTPPTAVVAVPQARPITFGETDSLELDSGWRKQDLYTLFRFTAPGWRYSLPVWVHRSQLFEGLPAIDQFDLPISWQLWNRESCPLKMRDMLG